MHFLASRRTYIYSEGEEKPPNSSQMVLQSFPSLRPSVVLAEGLTPYGLHTNGHVPTTEAGARSNASAKAAFSLAKVTLICRIAQISSWKFSHFPPHFSYWVKDSVIWKTLFFLCSLAWDLAVAFSFPFSFLTSNVMPSKSNFYAYLSV